MIQDGQRVEAAVVNPAFMSRLVDTSTVGKVSLLNPNSISISDAQNYINSIADFLGTIENDPLLKQYISTNYIANGNSIKQAVEALDAALKQVSDDLVYLDAREANNHSAHDLAISNLTLSVNEIFDNDDHLNFKQSYAVAGEDIIAGVYAVTFVDNTASQSGRVVKCSNNFAANRFKAAGILILEDDVLEDEVFSRRSLFASGVVHFADDFFSSSDIGKTVYLGNNGELDLNAPTSSGSVVFSLGTVTGKNSMLFVPSMIGVL